MILELQKAVLKKLRNDLVQINIKEEVDLNVDDIHLISDTEKSMMKGRYYVLFVPPVIGNICPKAIKECASKRVNERAIAKAIVVGSIASRLTSNFFIKFSKPPVPTRAFTCQSLALEWMSQVKTELI